jgi:hypothetical protein
MRLALAIGSACLLAGCGGGDEPKVDPTQRDVNRIVAAVADVVYQCRAVQTGFVDRIDGRSVRRDVDVLLDAWERLSADSRFRTATGASTLRRQSRLTIRQLGDGCAPKQADRLEEAMED